VSKLWIVNVLEDGKYVWKLVNQEILDKIRREASSDDTLQGNDPGARRDWNGLDRTGLESNGQERIGLAGLERTGQDGTGIERTGKDRTGGKGTDRIG